MNHRQHTFRSMTAMDAKIIRTHMRQCQVDPEYSTPTTRELARYRWRQEWQGRRVRVKRPARPQDARKAGGRCDRTQ